MLRHGCWALGLGAWLAQRAVAWNHVSQSHLQDALDSSGYTLVACKCLPPGVV